MTHELASQKPPEIEKTEQDLVPITPKTFMNRRVVNQQRFDDHTAERFLELYARTGRKGDSAHAAGVTYNTVRNWELKDHEFGQLVIEAHEKWLNHLEREMYRHAVEGVLEPVVSGGKVVTYVRRYDHKTLALLAKKADPTGYGNRERVNVNVNTGVLRVPAAITTIEDSPLPVEDVDDDI